MCQLLTLKSKYLQVMENIKRGPILKFFAWGLHVSAIYMVVIKTTIQLWFGFQVSLPVEAKGEVMWS